MFSHSVVKKKGLRLFQKKILFNTLIASSPLFLDFLSCSKNSYFFFGGGVGGRVYTGRFFLISPEALDGFARNVAPVNKIPLENVVTEPSAHK